jgi:DNA-binding NarL/FixJ family response regulator
MVAIAVYSPDPSRGRALDALLRTLPEVTVVGLAAEPSALIALLDESYVDLAVMDAPLVQRDLGGRRPRIKWLALVDETDPESLEALRAGAAAILPRSAGRDAFAIAITATMSGLTVLPQALAAVLIEPEGPADAPAVPGDAPSARLTPRELEVLAKMADGASNKAIARALDISFHTAKFHVAAILAKLDADTRTEAVTRAAQLGLVML